MNFNFILTLDNTDHYMPFQRVYGTETTEEYRPTYMQSQANAEPIPKSILIGEKIRGYMVQRTYTHQLVRNSNYNKVT